MMGLGGEPIKGLGGGWIFLRGVWGGAPPLGGSEPIKGLAVSPLRV